MKRSSKTDELAPATISEADGVRYLHLGTPWVQGAMRIAKPQAIELEYVQRMMVWMLLRPEAEVTRGHAVQLGLGAATITRFCHSVLRMRATAVELNPTVITACRLWFRLPDDSARLKVLEQDAGQFVADPAHVESAQVLCVDLYDHDAASPVLDSEAFYRDCWRTLADGGVMTVNLFGRDASFERSAQRIAAAFGEAQLWALRPTREGNTIVVAAKGVTLPERATLAARAENIETRFGLPARKWLRMFRPISPTIALTPPSSTLAVASTNP
ncbi:spermidine synthase [Piscinibacter sp.]|jgi:spermidine synthase|uniref:spermidine synthase n=1 Tax=Piscinibacter sp. TaxID=1903157 RepID=UPI003559E3CC